MNIPALILLALFSIGTIKGIFWESDNKEKWNSLLAGIITIGLLLWSLGGSLR